MESELVSIGSVPGRLVRPLNKKANPFRWMGCKIAVYDFVVPRESGMEGRKVRSSLGRKRRGCRSRRGGTGLARAERIRKRRALVGARERSHALNPDPIQPTPSTVRIRISTRVTKAFEHKRAYLQALVDVAKRRLGSISRMKERFPTDESRILQDGQTVGFHLNKLRCRYGDLRRSWFRLSRPSGDSNEFLQMRWRILVHGLPVVAARVAQTRRRPALETPLERDTGDLVTDRHIKPAGCKRCESWEPGSPAWHGIPFCRQCGRRLAPFTRVGSESRGGPSGRSRGARGGRSRGGMNPAAAVFTPRGA